MARAYAKDPQVNESLRHSVRDGVAYSVMSGAGETYFSAFALHLKASTTQIGLIASLPSLIASFMQLLSAWLGHKTHRRRRMILAGASIQALVWLPLIVLPLLFPHDAVPLLIACIVIYYGASNFVAPQWSSLMGDLVPERRRGRYFGIRTRYATITAFVAMVCGGLILHVLSERDLALAGFVSIFAIAALARCVSLYHLTSMHEPSADKVASMEVPTPARHWWKRIHGSPFVRFSLFFAFMQCSVAIASPFFAVYMLRDLKYSYLEFMATLAISVLTQFLTLNAWGRISDVFGNRLILVLTGCLIPFLPALWLVSANFWYLMGIQLIGGLAWAGFGLSAGNFLYDLVPAPKRSTYLGIHSVFTNIGVFAGALVGGYLGTHLPTEMNVAGHTLTWQSALLGVFLVSSVARLCVALAFLPRLREVRPVRPMTVGGLIFRVTRFNAFSELIYDIVAGSKRPRPEKKSGR